MDWLGSERTFNTDRLNRIEKAAGAVSGRVLNRQRARVDTLRAKVRKAKQDLEVAKAALSREQEVDVAILSRAISNHLVRLVAPIFPMGPAWTLLRVVTAHVSAEEIATETEFVLDPRRKVRVEKEIKDERVELSRKLQAALDLWASDKGFGRDMREAMVAVAKKYEAPI